MTRHLLIAKLAVFALANLAYGHPGHGEPGDDFSVAHYITEPLHLGVIACVLAGAILLGGFLRAGYRRRREHETAC